MLRPATTYALASTVSLLVFPQVEVEFEIRIQQFGLRILTLERNISQRHCRYGAQRIGDKAPHLRIFAADRQNHFIANQLHIPFMYHAIFGPSDLHATLRCNLYQFLDPERGGVDFREKSVESLQCLIALYFWSPAVVFLRWLRFQALLNCFRSHHQRFGLGLLRQHCHNKKYRREHKQPKSGFSRSAKPLRLPTHPQQYISRETQAHDAVRENITGRCGSSLLTSYLSR